MVPSRRANRANKGKKNTLTFIPRGFKHPIDVPFPERRLPVCKRCKKNFKTREFCRSRDGHTGSPWSLTYVCITLDQGCTDENGKLVEGPFVARSLPPQPFSIKGDLDPETPICTPCKEKNYTRSYCRKKQGHRHLPWSAVYALLSVAKPIQNGKSAALPQASNAIKPIKTLEESKEKPLVEAREDDAKEPKEPKEAKEPKESKEPPSKKVKVEETESDKPVADPDTVKPAVVESDEIETVPTSRTFVTKISTEINTLHWLDIDTNLISVAEWNDVQNQAAFGRAQDPYSDMRNQIHNVPVNQQFANFPGANSGYPGVGAPGYAMGGWGGGNPGPLMQGPQLAAQVDHANALGQWGNAPNNYPMHQQWLNHQNNMNFQFPQQMVKVDPASAASAPNGNVNPARWEENGMANQNAMQMGMFPQNANYPDPNAEQVRYV